MQAQPSNLFILAAIGAISGLGSLSQAQSTIPAPPDHELHPVWGGQSQAVHTSNVAAGHRIIVGTGGGGIRYSNAGGAQGSWVYADTPDDFTHTLIDIEFLDDDIGFACGRGGQVLQTADGGRIWTNFGNPVIDPCGDLATNWSLYPMSSDTVFVVGLWLAKVTIDAGQTWIDLELSGFNTSGIGTPYDGPTLLANAFHFYSMDVAGPIGQFKGALAAEYEDPSGTHMGVVFHTDAAEAGSSVGRKWRMTLNDHELSTSLGVAPLMMEPWGLCFERGATPASAVAYVAGGLGANSPGRVYRSPDGGNTWTAEVDLNVTPYSVTAEVGRTMVGAYSGLAWTRDMAGGWSSQTLPGPPGGLLTPGFTTAALNVVDSADPLHFVVGGGFGLNMQTTDGGATWIEASPYYQLDIEELRVKGLATLPGVPTTAIVVGQGGILMKTVNDGEDWAYQRAEPSGKTLWAVDFRDASNGIAAGNSGALLYTTDGGTTWTPGTTVMGSTSSVNFRDIVSVGNNEAWAVGQDTATGEGAVAFTRTAGQAWFRLSAPQQSKLALEGVVFPEPTKGLVVGWSGSQNGTTRARAYTADFDPISGLIQWVEVSPKHPLLALVSANPVTRKLHGIDSVGTNLSTAVIYAVGNGGMVLRWNGAISRFVNVPGVYELNRRGRVRLRELATDLPTVGISPSGNRVLIGAQYDINMHNAADFGWMLELDGVWSRTRTHSGKDIVGISLTSDSEGFVIGQTNQNASAGLGMRLHGCHGYTSDDVVSPNFDNPNLADPVVLKYLSN